MTRARSAAGPPTVASAFITSTSPSFSEWPKSAPKCCLFDEIPANHGPEPSSCVCNRQSLLIRKMLRGKSWVPAVENRRQANIWRINMKKLVLAAALTGAASFASAGTYEEPVIEEPVIVEETEASSSAVGVVIPLVLLAIVAAAIAAD